MPPETRRSAFPKVVIERDTDSEQSSSEEEEDDEPAVLAESESDEKFEEHKSKNKGKAPITISLKKVCKVCKKPGHEAGFKGATYIDCPMKPCFLCKMPGHTTVTCPHRVATEFGVIPAARKSTRNALEYAFERQIRPRIHPIKPAYVIPDQVSCAVIRYHSRRVTCLEFHPTNNNILLSGDKKGQIGVWDFRKVYEKVVYGNVHSCILNNMKFSPASDGTVYAASSDGTISCTDVETGIALSLMNLNPGGWQGPSTWRMLYGMDMNAEKCAVLVADNFGYLYFCKNVKQFTKVLMKQRLLLVPNWSVLVVPFGSELHSERLNCSRSAFFKIKSIVPCYQCAHCEPNQKKPLQARIWDIRRIEDGSSIYDLAHSRVVNSAYFSPVSGSKILTTSQDNRLCIWDSIFGDMDSPSREIVHSHDFNRYLTPFRAEWDPKDSSESLAVIGRYISENYNGAALHPIDFIDISTGQLVAEIMDPNITTISPVNKLHPRDDVLASGSSRSLFIWRPKEKSEPVEQMDVGKILVCDRDEKKSRKRKFGGESDDSDDDKSIPKGKGFKSQKKSQGSGQMGVGKILVCDRDEKKSRKRKFEDESADSDDDKSIPKGKRYKSQKK